MIEKPELSEVPVEREKLKLFGYFYDVEVGPSINLRAAGDSIVPIQRIRIASDQHPQGRISTLGHEAIHAMTKMIGMDIPEDDVMRLETCFFTFLVDNGVDLTPLMRFVED